MKKAIALLLALFLALGMISAVAEDAPAPIKLGQVDFAAHGTSCFAVVTVAVQGDVIVAALIDEFQYGAADAVTPVPNSEGMAGNVAEGKVLYSKRANAAYYSNNMASRAGSIVALNANYDAIQAHVVGKTVGELETELAGLTKETAVDAVTGSTLVDTYGYLTAILEAAKAAGAQTGTYTLYNKTGENIVELTFTDNVTGEVSANLAGDGFAADAQKTVTYTIPGGEDGHGRLTFTFKTEGGYVGVFATLSIEVAPMTLLEVDAESGATTLNFFAPQAE